MPRQGPGRQPQAARQRVSWEALEPAKNWQEEHMAGIVRIPNAGLLRTLEKNEIVGASPCATPFSAAHGNASLGGERGVVGLKSDSAVPQLPCMKSTVTRSPGRIVTARWR